MNIEKIIYKEGNLFFSINDLLFHIVLKPGRGYKWLKWKNVMSVFLYISIENRMVEEKVPVRNVEKFIESVFQNFPTLDSNTNEYSRRYIWDWRKRKANQLEKLEG